MRRILLSAGTGNYPINTIIKGVSTTVTTKENLASMLSIDVRRIRRFDLFPDRLEVSIRGNYVMTTAFRNNTLLTDYLDVGGLINSIPSGAFSGCTNLINLQINNASLSNGALSGMINLTNPAFGGTLRIRRFASISGLYGAGLKKVIVDTDSFQSGVMRDMPNLEEVVQPNVEWIDSDCFNGCSKLASLTTGNVTTLGNRAFNATGFVNLDFPKLTTLGGVSPFTGLVNLKTIKFGSLVNVTTSESFLSSNSLLELIDMKKVKNYGGTTIATTPGLSARFYGFNNVKLGCVIEANISLATANTNDGTAHEALKWAKTARQAVVKFYDDNGNYVSTL